jgi:hypothetical protein
MRTRVAQSVEFAVGSSDDDNRDTVDDGFDGDVTHLGRPADSR